MRLQVQYLSLFKSFFNVAAVLSSLPFGHCCPLLLLLYSLFEFEKYGDENFGAEKSGFVEQAQRPKDGKLEKSYLNFQKVHPNFDGGAAAKTLYGRLNTFKDVQ